MKRINVDFVSQLKSMVKFDLIRCLKSKLFYILLGIAFVMPILILVMTTLMEGSVTTDPNGNQTAIEGFKNVWDIIGSVAGGQNNQESGMSMGLTAMCNINLIYFAIAVFVCIFVAEDFKSGYSKNLFTVRASKVDYVTSKTIVTCSVGMVFILAFFIGALLGGGIAGLSFNLEGVKTVNIIMCLLSKMFLMVVIVPIYLTMAIVSKQKLWLAILLSVGGGALLFTMIPLITPLNATILNVLLCLAGGVMFSAGLGAVSSVLLNKRDIL